MVLSISSPFVYADPYPPTASNGAAHWDPVPWPAELSWNPYTHQGSNIKDARSADPSNGGTAPQNFANVSSSCTDQSQPSVSWAFSPSTPFLPDVFFFRWKVEQIANSYATGPSSLVASSVDPWKCAQWTVLMDVNGDGFYDFAVNIDGCSGLPSTAIDVIKSIYNSTKSQSTDYVNDPGVYLIAHNPTAFVDPGTGYILNFQNSYTPVASWPNGSAETVWDYGTTRAMNITTYSPTKCIEYQIDYQIPLGMLDATPYGGPQITSDTPFCMTFVTANSNINPLQKDVAFDTMFLGDVDKCVPCGDLISANGGTFPQPTVDWVTATGCGPTTLTAQVRDALNCDTAATSHTLSSVIFWYYYDKNGNGIADDTGSSWTLIGAASVGSTPNIWTVSNWNTTGLKNGQYLIGVEATDTDSPSHTTWSYLTQAEVDIQHPGDYANASPSPGVVFGTFTNTCGTYARVSKTVSPSYVAKGDTVDFTITISNRTGSPLTVTDISDTLPPNFTYVSTTGGTLQAPCSTAAPPGATGTISWTCSSPVIENGGTGTLIFRADTDNAVTGTYTNKATAATVEEGTLTSNPVDVSVGAPRLTIAKSASVPFANPGDTITYTITYSNDSPVNTTGVSITDTLPVGLTFVSASNGGVYNSGTKTITWTLPNLASGEGPYTVSFNATVNLSATAQPQNISCIDSSETDPACAGVVVNVNTPLKIQKSANPVMVTAGNQITFTINYSNTGLTGLTGTTITDQIPTGFTYVSASPTPSPNPPVGGTVIWNIGNLAPGASGTCTLTVQASSPYTGTNPAINTTTITADSTISVTDSAQVGVVQGTCTSPATYHMHAQTTDVGFDGTQNIANTTAPTSATDTIITSPQTDPTGSEIEFARFYQDPPLSSGGTIVSPVSVSYWGEKVQGAPTVYAYLYDYDPDTGATILLGSGSGSPVGTLKEDTITVTLTSNTVYQGHRLLWIFTVQGNGSSIKFYYDSTAHSARSSICPTPTNLVLNKFVDKIATTQGDTLQYTIRFGNSSPQNVTGAQIIDTLPVGVTYNSATLNGVAATPASISGQIYTFNVRTSDSPPMGQLTSGQTGTLVINVTIENPIIFDHNPLINVAVLDTAQTEPISDTATTYIKGVPVLGIKKRASSTLLKPGDSVTFFLDIVNIGSAISGDYTVTDYYTESSYYFYQSSNPSGTNSCVDSACTIIWNLTDLAPGASRTVSYTMQVSGSIDPPTSGGVPEGFNTETDYAEVSYMSGANSSTSNSVLVTIATNPNLRLTKSVTSPAATADSVCGPGCALTVNTTLSQTPVQPGKLRILVNGAEAALDSGTGIIIGANFKNSTINYTTGALHLEFITAPAGGDIVTASYNVPASPGDTLSYTMVVSNTGGTNAENVLFTDPIPLNTTYQAGTLSYDSVAKTDANDSSDNAYFDAVNNRVVFVINDGSSLTFQDLLPGQSHTIRFSVTINDPLPNGTLTTSNTATASSSNTASKNATATFNVNAAPVLKIYKSAPSLIPYPLTYVNGNHTGQTVINVYSTQYFAAGDVVIIGGNAVSVTAVNAAANQITVSSPVSPSNKSLIYPTIRYRFSYNNTGTSDATNVVITDVLATSPNTGLLYIQANPAPTSAPPVGSNGTVTWNLGTVAAGSTGTITLWARPTGQGTYTNSGTMSSDEIPAFSSNTTSTIVGALKLSKSTSTPTIVNNPADGQDYATYAIVVTNESGSVVTGLSVTDTLPAGFTYNNTVSITGGVCQFSPTAGSATPTWSNCIVPLFSINNPTGSVLTITFRAALASTVGEGTYQNPVTATHATLPVIPFDELATTAEDVSVTIPYDLRVTKAVTSLTPACSPPTCQVTYQVTITNVGTAAMSAVSVTDSLPAELTYISAVPSLGSISYSAPTITWSVGNLAVNASATLDITASVNSFPAPIRNCASLVGPKYPPTAGGDSNPGNDTGCADIIPTLVTLSDFRAYEEDGRVVVEWMTSSEHDTAGFYLYRLDESTGDYIRINRKLLPALLTSPQGGTYSLIDTGASPESGNLTYLIIEMEGKGSRNVYGPFSVLPGGESVTGSLNPDPGKLQIPGSCLSGTCADTQGKASVSEITLSFDTSGNLFVTNRKDGSRQTVRTDTGTDVFENYTRKSHEMSDERKVRLQTLQQNRGVPNKVMPAGNAIKIAASQKGLYYIDATKIGTLLGISSTEAMDMIRTNLLAVSNKGQDIAYLPAQDNAGIFFYGEGIDSKYTSENIYWIGKAAGVKIKEVGGRGRLSAMNGTFTEKLHFEQDRFIAPAITQDPDVDYFFWEAVESGDPGTCGYCARTFPVQVNGVAAGSAAKATLTANLFGFSDTIANPDHHIKVYMNDTLIGEGSWDGQQPHTSSFDFDQALLNEGGNTIKVEGLLDTGAEYSYFYINSFDLSYQRLYKAMDNALLLRADGNPVVTVTGFTEQDILVLEVTNPQRPRLLSATTIDGTAGNYQVSFKPSGANAVYLAVATGAAATGMNTWADSPSSLKSPANSADYLIITPEELKPAADSLAAHRQSWGLKPMVVLLEDIMDEFHYGISSPEAIKDFLSYAYGSWTIAPRYVVLMGEASYDYKDSLGFGENLTPTMIAGTPMGVYPSDNLFADTDGDHVPEMAIGRFPLLSADEFTPVLNKIQAFEAGINKRVLMLADNPDSGGEFITDSDDVATLVPLGYPVVKIYLTDPSQGAAVRQTLINEMNSGSMLVNYIGHAGLDRLAWEGLLRTIDLGSLSNGSDPPVLTAMTCNVGRFAMPGYDSLSESLVLKNGGGAVAVWAPTGLSYNNLAKMLDEGFFSSAFAGTTVLGDTIINAFRKYESMGGPVYTIDLYNLQGDPALKMR